MNISTHTAPNLNDRIILPLASTLILVALSFRAPLVGVTTAILFLVVSSVLSSGYRERVLFIVPPLATMLILCGGFLSPVLIVAGALLLSASYQAEKPAPFPCLAIMMWVWVFAEFFCEVLRFADSPFSVSEWIDQTPRLLRQVEIASSLTVLNLLAQRPSIFGACLKWITPALIVSLIFMAGQLALVFNFAPVPEFFSWNLTPFFAQQGRVTGTFPDPNSAGIALAALTITFAVRRNWMIAILSLTGTLLTGSRSALIAISIFGIVECLRKLFSRIKSYENYQNPFLRGAFISKLVAFFTVSLTAIIVLNILPISTIEGFPSGLGRVARSLRYDTFEQSLFSRTALWHIAVAQWMHAPILGVGLDRYRELLPPFAQALDIPIGAWSDNAGSWPLFVIVELGLIGMLVLALDVLALSVVRNYGVMVIASAVILFFGCHIHDPLAAIVYGAVAALGVSQVDTIHKKFKFYGMLINVIAIPFVVISSMSFTRGVYPWEIQDGMLVRWTGADASLLASCRNDGIFIKELAPSVVQQNLIIAEGSYRLSTPVKSQPLLALSCNGNSGGGNRYITIQIEPTWVPKKFGVGEDSRSLGVALEYHQPIDLDAL